MKSIDIDIGGTFTDCYVHWEGKTVLKKAPTTPYDLSVGLIQTLKETSAELNVPFEELIPQVERFRYSTTVAMNRLIERKGPKLGLITTEGFEDVIFVGKASQWQDGMTLKYRRNLAQARKPQSLIKRHHTVGIKERIDSFGQILRPLDEDDVREKLQYLVDQGVRGFVVTCLFSYLNPVHERRIKEIIEEEYPDYYLGAMPVFLSSEIHPKRDEYTRSNTTILNGYLHQLINEEVGKIRDELIKNVYRGSILMVHNTGGMAESIRTSAVQTFNGGPVAGLMGGAHFSKQYGLKNAVVADMGGTSFDIGVIAGGSTRSYQNNPVIDRFLVDLPILDSKSIGAGGGSIAKINYDFGKRLEVGPESAGSMPGPVCYNQGGNEPTVTDADLVLGYINPDYFHGGKKKLNYRKAYRAIKQNIADPLNISTEEAALLIKKVVDANMGNEIRKETVLKGLNPKDFALFAIGGGGPMHATGLSDVAGIKKIMTFPFSSVFCAYSSSTMDIMHIYEYSKKIPLIEPNSKKYFTDYEAFNSVVNQLKEKAIRDIVGEGFSEEQIVFQLELDMKYGGQLNILRASSPLLSIESPADITEIYNRFEKEYSEAYSAMGTYPEGGVDIENFVLKAVIPQKAEDLKTYEFVSEDPNAALKELRDAYWEVDGGKGIMLKTPVYDYRLLQCGNKIKGPAIIESVDTTYVISIGWTYVLDQYLNGIIEKEG
ncbi:acetophenone carboxylase [Bacillus sp. M6-12]|uniref:hydantoinase/oxoprolinase family protein n=1 Tax=Bacillus sp. M6-12 TaxID=2054166 RepID=UPI000C760ABC|nr:hydantoinase/oxoprolinase family protein [Bacillus sp. M6-12]PLS15279.1 acetophenone carboxylase [Bacillus sp. M6-12]